MESLPKNAFYSMILDDEQMAFVAAIKDPGKSIVFCDAPAGTGKTTLAKALAKSMNGAFARVQFTPSAPMEKGSKATSPAVSPRNRRSTTSQPIRR